VATATGRRRYETDTEVKTSTLPKTEGRVGTRKPWSCEPERLAPYGRRWRLINSTNWVRNSTEGRDGGGAVAHKWRVLSGLTAAGRGNRFGARIARK
jgi:hypothetical protein